jgi:osmotically-inducible protein OsmY
VAIRVGFRTYVRSTGALAAGSAGIYLLLLLLCVGVAAASAAQRAIRDGDITRAIEADLWANRAVDANTIDVATQEGIVTLSGSVDSILARDRTREIAESIVGVRGILDRLEVNSMPRDDASLVRAVQDALMWDPATDSYEVQVGASQGLVTLRGSVDSWAEKQLSGAVAKGVRGVRGLENEIDIRHAAERSDPEIEAEVESRLANDVRVDDYAIDVAVDEGAVTLSGTVGSLAEKERAKGDAWISGVRSVDVDGLAIDWWARDAMRRKSMFQSRTDEEVARAVRDAFVYDPRVSSFDPQLHVSTGVVTLSGVVDNAAARRAAESDARNVVGVWRVRNHLKVRPETIPDDEALEKRVERALAADEYVERWDVNVDAHSGTIFLTGIVNGSFEKARAGRRAARVKGTVEVVNDIEYQHAWEWKPDWEIRAAVEDQISWSPFVDGHEVNVSVEDGVVTLTGQVDTWAERADAAENAWEGGAKDVRNELTVVHRVYGPIAYPYDLRHAAALD